MARGARARGPDIARVPRAPRGPRADGERRHRQDAHGLGAVHDGVRAEDGGPILHRVVARHAPQARPRRAAPRPEGRAHRPREAARHRRTRLPPLDPDGARPLFQVFADPYERQSVAITTNLEISRWGAVFGDDQMAAAVIDRIVHHGRLVQFRGESYRVRNALTQEGQVRKNAAHPGRANCSKIDDHSTQKLLTKHMWGEHGKTMVKMHPAETFIVRTVRSFSRSRKARRCLVPSRFLHAFREPHMSAIRYGYSSSSVTPR